MALINVGRIVGVVRRGSTPYLPEIRGQFFSPFNTRFDNASSRMFYEENGRFRIARPARSFTRLGRVNLHSAQVVPDTTKGIGKVLTNHDAFIDYLKAYSSPVELQSQRQVFLILHDRWVEVGKEKYPYDLEEQYFVVQYQLQGSENPVVRKKLTVKKEDDVKEEVGHKVLFTRKIFEIKKGEEIIQVDQDQTSQFQLYYHFSEKEGQVTRPMRRLMNSTPEEEGVFTIRAPEPEQLRSKVDDFIQSIKNRIKERDLLIRSVNESVEEERREMLLDQVDALLLATGVGHRDPRELLEDLFLETYGGVPDKDDLNDYLAIHFEEDLSLFVEE